MTRRLPLIALVLAALPGCAVVSTQAPDQSWVLVCHRGKTLEIAAPALDAHLRHGDYQGACPTAPGDPGL